MIKVPNIRDKKKLAAWQQGFRGMRENQAMEDCPYPESDVRRRWWLHGWQMANDNQDQWTPMAWGAEEIVTLGLRFARDRMLATAKKEEKALRQGKPAFAQRPRTARTSMLRCFAAAIQHHLETMERERDAKKVGKR